MQYLIEFIIFLIVLFLYIHVHYHVSTSNDLEVYELSDISKERVEDICNLKQPVIINNQIEAWSVFNRDFLLNTNSYKEYDLSIRNTSELGCIDELYLPLSYDKANTLFNKDSNSMYYTEDNKSFLENTALNKQIQSSDMIFRPPLTTVTLYDVLFGSTGSHTPLRYEVNFRNYLYVSQGSATIKLIPPNYDKNLHPIMDYENFEFRSSINPWNVQKEFLKDFGRIKVIDVTLNEGQTLFVPPYWYYSIKLNENCFMLTLKYRNYFNIVSILPYLGMHFMQMQNVKQEKYKKIVLDDDKDPKESDENDTQEIN